MSHVDELIAELCPHGVRYIEVAQLFDLRNGYTPSKSKASFWLNGTVPWFRMEDIRTNGGVLDHALQQIPEVAVKGGRLFPANSLLVATSATIGEHAVVTVPHLSNQRFTSLSIKPQFADKIDMKFMYYYGFVLDEWCRNNTTTSSFASVDMTGFKRFKFPVPPLAIQREIVQVLDQFTQLEAELEAELEARRRQYEYCRGNLLKFTEGIEWSTLGEVAEYANGKAHERLANSDGAIPMVTARFISRNGEANRFVHLSDVLTPAIEGDTALVLSDLPNGRALARTFFVDRDYGYAINQRVARLRVRDRRRLEPRFLYHFLDRNPGLLMHDNGTDQTHLSKGQVTGLRFPVPVLEEQRRISSILDKFDALVNDLSIGLPAELAARRKQYEYYRDELLTFKEAAA